MGTIIPFVPLAKSFVKYLPKIADRPFSKIEAAFCLMVDYDDQNEVTISGYAKLWQWNKKTVSKFIINHGARIIYPKDTTNHKNQRGLISILKRDLKGTNKGLITFIDNKDLATNRDLTGTKQGLNRDKSLPSTIEPKPEPKENIPQNEFAEGEQEELYLTKKKRKLKGKRLETFLLFWEAFNYKKDKASAADSWFEIPELTDKLVNSICESARKENDNRNDLIQKGMTPKFAQGWLTSKRWEDEESGKSTQDNGDEKAKKQAQQTAEKFGL